MKTISDIKRYIKVYYVTRQDDKPDSWLFDTVKQAVEGGITMVELREKDAPKEKIIELATELLNILKGTGVPLIINDYVDVCLITKADGLHLGQNDLDPDVARSILGPDAIIGISTGTQEEVKKACDTKSIDYIAMGTVFPTQTKKDCKRIIGVEGLRSLVSVCTKPCVAIGGINASNTPNVMSTGIDGICACMAIQQENTVKESAEVLSKAVLSSRKG